MNMPEASCPDQICVHHNKISRNKETIVCLPDRVVITIENGEDSGIDICSIREKKGMIMAKKTALLGMLVALAFVLSYIETLIPVNLGIPGAKLGLANLVVMVALYTTWNKGSICTFHGAYPAHRTYV